MSPLHYEPRGDRVIVRRLAPPEPKDGELYIPASQQKPLNEGVVVAVGPGVCRAGSDRPVQLDLAEGDVVCFVDYAGFPIEVDGEEYLSLRDEEIHGRRT